MVSHVGHKNRASSGLCESVGIVTTFVLTKQDPYVYVYFYNLVYILYSHLTKQHVHTFINNDNLIHICYTKNE